MFTLEAIEKEADFTVRANQFASKMDSLALEFPDMLVEPRNKTLRDLEGYPSKIWDLQAEYPELVQSELAKSRETEIESSFKNVVEVDFYSNSVDEISEFISAADKIAEDLGGTTISKRVSRNGDGSGYFIFSFDGTLHYKFE